MGREAVARASVGRPVGPSVGRRVELRTPSRRDLPEFLDAVRASRALHHRWVSPPACADDFAHWLRSGRQENQARFLVRRRSDGAIAGVINLNEIIRGAFQNAFVGFYAFADRTGSGEMTEALTLVKRHAFRTLGLHRLEANIQPGNERSIALVKRVGFSYEGFSPKYLKINGRWRDHEHWVAMR